jgi:hypothetical protein
VVRSVVANPSFLVVNPSLLGIVIVLLVAVATVLNVTLFQLMSPLTVIAVDAALRAIVKFAAVGIFEEGVVDRKSPPDNDK